MASSVKPKNQRIHDLRSVYMDFKIVYDMLQSGYRFDDKDGPELLAQLKKGLALFKSEIDTFEKESKKP